jgi:Cu(I)/Ag(I) efflux system membrane protein CusA/SilA
MINRIIDLSVRNKLTVFAIIAIGCAFGFWSMMNVPLDATPDISDTQVIVYSQWDRSPDLVENQVTYPIVLAMLGTPHVKTVRGFSDFGYSYVYVIFEDNTDLDQARTRTLEHLNRVLSKLPEGVKTELGPDATGLGWVYQYALVDTSGKHTISELRSFQDWYLRYYLSAVPGVAEVAPIGGFTRQYQVNVDPEKLRAYGISTKTVVDAVRGGNLEASGRLVEFGGTEYMVRGRGYASSVADFENIVVATSPSDNPIRIGDLGQVSLGPDLRRGTTDFDGNGETVSGIVVMRTGENALELINRVKAKLKEIEPGLPSGVKIVPVYDRSELILRSVSNSKQVMMEVIATVVLIILIFLWHVPSAVIPIITIPVAVLLSFIPFRMLGISANIMSLAGMTIAFGALVDASIVVVEQAHKKLEKWESQGRAGDYTDIVLGAVKEVAGPTFFALLVIAVSFLPVLTLEAQEGRMFKPLAYTKTLAMIIAALLAVTLDPALRLLLTRAKRIEHGPVWLQGVINTVFVGRIHSENHHPITRVMTRMYEPVVRWTLRWRWTVITTALAIVVFTIPVFFVLGSEFMPPLEEGSILYMPTTMPGISIGNAQQLLRSTDEVLKSFPEVQSVFGKAGRAETATDPAPLSMLETVIVLKPQSQWRHVDTWYSAWAPEILKRLLRHITSDRISKDELVQQMNTSLQLPGVSNAWTMPIKGRTEMLSTGIRTSLGLKISGDDPAKLQEIAERAEKILASVSGARNVFAERLLEGFYLDVVWNRDQLARYGLKIEDAQQAVQNAIGGENISTAVIGRERYPVNVRYMRDYRTDLDAIGRVLVSNDGKRQIPVSQLAEIKLTKGPAMLRNENGLLTGYVYIDLDDRHLESYRVAADRILQTSLKIPAGYSTSWAGQYESMQRVRHKLKLVIPLTLFLALFLLYLNTRSVPKTLIITLAVPFSAVGAIWFLYFAGYKVSVAVWVGLLALLGIDAGTGVFMLLYLDLAYVEAMRGGRLNSVSDLHEAIVQGAAKRLRPKFMTFATTCLGLLPIMWSMEAGSDVMKRIAAPMIGGIATSFLLELMVYPAIYEIWRRRSLKKHATRAWETMTSEEPVALFEV